MSTSKDQRALKTMIEDIKYIDDQLSDGNTNHSSTNTIDGLIIIITTSLTGIKTKLDRLKTIRSNNKHSNNFIDIGIRNDINTDITATTDNIKKVSGLITSSKLSNSEKEVQTKIVQSLFHALNVIKSTLLSSFTSSIANSQIIKNNADIAAIQHRQLKAKNKTTTDSGDHIHSTTHEVPTDEESVYMTKVNKNISEQNKILDQIGKGLDDLKDIAMNANKQLTIQDNMLDQTDVKMDINIQHLKTANGQLKTILEESGGSSRWGPIIMLCIVLLCLTGVIFGIV
jgi:hypothetical protein